MDEITPRKKWTDIYDDKFYSLEALRNLLDLALRNPSQVEQVIKIVDGIISYKLSQQNEAFVKELEACIFKGTDGVHNILTEQINRAELDELISKHKKGEVK